MREGSSIMSEYEYDWPEEQTPAAFCDQYNAHESHVYIAINGNTYACPGLTSAELAAIEAYDPGTCAHGMNADLCADPINHYPRDM